MGVMKKLIVFLGMLWLVWIFGCKKAVVPVEQAAPIQIGQEGMIELPRWLCDEFYEAVEVGKASKAHDDIGMEEGLRPCRVAHPKTNFRVIEKMRLDGISYIRLRMLDGDLKNKSGWTMEEL